MCHDGLRVGNRTLTPNPSPVGEGSCASTQQPAHLRRALASAAFDLGDEGGDGSSDRLGMILLQKMNAVSKLDEPAILELAGEVLRIRRRDERASNCR